MSYKSTIIILTLLLLLSFTVSAQAKTISLLSEDSITAAPQSLFIELELRGADQNKSRLQNQFRGYINDFKANLIDNSSLTAANIKQSHTQNSSYTKDTGYNNPQIHKKTLTLELKVTAKSANKLQSTTQELIELIADNTPRSYGAQYNSLSELELNYKQAYYFFQNPQELQRKLFTNILEKSKTKSQTLAKLLTSNSITLKRIEEIKSSSISNQQQSVNINNPQLPTAQELNAKLKIDYQLN